MKKIPCMISCKDLSYISDIFNWNMNAYVKINHYLDLCKDEEVSTCIKKLSKIHKKNCATLVDMIKECNNEG